jgi:hypothetical protein
MSSTSERYEEAAKKFNEAYDKYTAKYDKDVEKYMGEYNKAVDEYAGDKGLDKATKYGEEQANRQSMMAGNQAGANANRAARTAGLSKAQAALMAEQASADTTGNTYQNMYNSSRDAGLQNNQATVNAVGYGSNMGINASNAGAQTALNARGNQLSAAQQEGQNAFNRAWNNVGGWGSMITGVLGSDARLKNFKNVSSKVGQPKETKNDWTLLKVTYNKEKK